MMPVPYDAQFYDRIAPGSRASANVVLPIVIEPFRVHSVVDVGCGTGSWLVTARELGVTRILGLDGAYVAPDQLLISPSEFRPADLAADLAIDETFDLVVSLEVAEHLPPRSADQFVRGLGKLGDVVLFGAAVPGQVGGGHLNEQVQSYWAERFAREGFRVFDVIRPRLWNDQRVATWYRQNTLLYVRAVRTDLVATAEALAAGLVAPLDIVHPATLLGAHMQRVGVRSAVRILAQESTRALDARIKRLRTKWFA